MIHKPNRDAFVRGRQPENVLAMYVIYDHPLDHPNHFVVRRWVGEVPDRECGLFDSLRDARLHLPRNLTRLPRWHDDDPAIYEVWL